MNPIINIPEGTRDRLFDQCRDVRQVQGLLTNLFSTKAYNEISTPEVEYYDLFVQSGNPIPQESMLKVVDRSGKIMVMRPDCTTPIARVASTKMSGMPFPQRLYYNQTVFRSGVAHRGGSAEIAQCGIELLGAEGAQADLEAITLAIESLRTVSPKGFHIELGHAGIFKRLADSLQLSQEVSEEIRHLIEGKQFAHMAQLLEPYRGQSGFEVLSRLSYLFGNIEVLNEAETLMGSTPELSYLRTLYNGLVEAGYGEDIRFDLGLVHQIEYYTGVVFRGYIQGAGAPVLSGGRYDNLLATFGRPAPAIGFAVDVDGVVQSLETPEVTTGLRIALTKGRLQDKTITLLESVGLDCTPVNHPGRRLIHTIPNYPLEVVLAKGPDVLTYVEHGVCDLGVVGKDTILEQSSPIYEVVDLGFGACRFVLAVKEGSDFYGTYKTRRIATKYPQVALRFFEGKGMDVEIIKIEGSVELAPILDLADAIVDIVETGATLRENGLIPIEEVTSVSARLVVNPAAMKLKKDQVLDFIDKCKEGLEALS